MTPAEKFLYRFSVGAVIVFMVLMGLAIYLEQKGV